MKLNGRRASAEHVLLVITSILSVNSLATTFALELTVCCQSRFTFAEGRCQPTTASSVSNPADVNASSRLRAVITQTDGPNSTASDSAQLPIILRTFLPDCRSTHVGRVSITPQDAKATHGSENGTDLTDNNNGVGSIRPTGYLIYDQHFYPPTEYCINGVNEAEDYLELVICDHVCNATEERTNKSKTASIMAAAAAPVSCLPKCCEPDQLLQSADSEFKCVPVHSNFSWNPVLHNASQPQEMNKSKPHESKSKSKLHFIHAHPSNWCKTDGFFMYQRDFPMNPKVEFHILKNGGIRYLNEADQTWEHLPGGTYCIDGIYDEDLLSQSMQNSSVTKDNNVIYYCPSEHSEEFVEVEESNRIQRISVLYYVVLIISSTFLLLTIIIHAISLDRQNIHGRTVLCCFVSLFCLYVFLALLHVTRLYLDRDPTNSFCWATGVGLHFFFLSTFSWLSVVNFDLWFTFRTFRTLISPTSHRFKRFVVYSVFAVGTPVVILAIALTVDYLQKNSISYNTNTGPQLIVPGYGQDGCFFSSHSATFVYLYGPIGLLLLMNLLLFVLTILSMYKLKKTSSVATSSSNSYANHPRQSFHLFLKLFVLMGVSWIFEVISWAAHPKTIPWYWVIFDLINICQGIFIFVIFTCKRSTLRVLEQKYPCIKGVTDACRLYIASLSCAKNCPNCQEGASSANNTTIQEMTARKLSDTLTVETDVGPT